MKASRQNLKAGKKNQGNLLVSAKVSTYHCIYKSTNINQSAEILRRGNKPTFVNRIRAEADDITLGTQHFKFDDQNLYQMSWKWSFFLYRHYIRFDLSANNITESIYRLHKL